MNQDFLTDLVLKNTKKVSIENSESVFVFCHIRHKMYSKIFLCLAKLLSEKGIPCVTMYYDSQFLDENKPSIVLDGLRIDCDLKCINRLVFRPSMSNNRRRFKHLDYGDKEIRIGNINFYEYIYNVIQRINREPFELNISDGRIRKQFDDVIDSTVHIYEKLVQLTEYSLKNKKKLKFIGWEGNYFPNGIINEFCRSQQNIGEFEYFNLALSNNTMLNCNKRDPNITISNFTKSKSNLQFKYNREEILKNIAGKKREELNIEIEKAIDSKKNRIDSCNGFKKNPENVHSTLKLVDEFRKKGKKIFVALPHRFNDFVYKLESPFESIYEWLSFIVEYCIKQDDLLILKPHPIESTNDMFHKPKLLLKEYINSINRSYSKNIIVVEPFDFTIQEISKVSDAALIWGSTAGLEFIYKRTPCLFAATPYFIEGVDLNVSKSKKDYLGHLNNLKKSASNVSKEQSYQAADYIHYMLNYKTIGMDVIDYSCEIDEWIWNRENLNNFIETGRSASLNRFIKEIL